MCTEMSDLEIAKRLDQAIGRTPKPHDLNEFVEPISDEGVDAQAAAAANRAMAM